MDDVDAVQAQIARNMLESGDWVTARLNGVAYLEKSPLKYWLIAIFFKLFGVYDWAARLPMALVTVALCWLTARIGAWAVSEAVGLYAGISLATCVGLFLFTRILIPDVYLTFTITLAMWALLRALDEAEKRPKLWAAVMAGSIGTGLLLKGLIAALFPIAAGLIYVAVSGQFLRRETWDRLRVVSGTAIALAIAAPWHVLATIQNPPYFYWSMKSVPGEYHGFFWFYFMNEHVLRFLNLRYPRDYNTVPPVYFWLFHLLWLFPWSVFFLEIRKLGFKPQGRGGQMRLLALCWIGFVLTFFSFSSTQEYYSMPCYPAFALLLGCAMAAPASWGLRVGQWVLGGISAIAALAIVAILTQVWNLPAPGDISQALTQNPDAYTLSLGHMGDLTLASFSYLRLPLIVAGIAFVIGAMGLFFRRGAQAYAVIVIMMVLFIHAARLALVVFDPYLSSRVLADALSAAPPGQLIEDNAYYTFSSVFFYTNRTALLLNGRQTNLEYGSNAPHAPKVFLDDPGFRDLWVQPQQYYLLVEGSALPRIEALVGKPALTVVKASGGKYLLSNHARSN